MKLLELRCPSCNRLIEATDSMAGCLIACPKCSEKLQIPTLCETAPVVKVKGQVSPDSLLHREAILPKTAPKDFQTEPADSRDYNSATISLVLGIISITLAVFVGITVMLLVKLSSEAFIVCHFGSLVTGILAVAQAKKTNRADAGMICGIVGIVLFMGFLVAIISEM